MQCPLHAMGQLLKGHTLLPHLTAWMLVGFWPESCGCSIAGIFQGLTPMRAVWTHWQSTEHGQVSAQKHHHPKIEMITRKSSRSRHSSSEAGQSTLSCSSAKPSTSWSLDTSHMALKSPSPVAMTTFAECGQVIVQGEGLVHEICTFS